MSIYDMCGRGGQQGDRRKPVPVSAVDAAAEVQFPAGSQVFLAHEYYSPADAAMQVFQVLGEDEDTGQCRAVNVDTGALRIIDADELVSVDDPDDFDAPDQQGSQPG